MTHDAKALASAPAGDGPSMYPKDHLENIEKAINYCDRRLADRFGAFIRATLRQCRHDASCGTFDNYDCDCSVADLAAIAFSRDHDHASGGKVIYGEAAEREARRHGADSFAGKEFASAPAGDGVPVAWMYEKKSSVSDLVRRIVNADRDEYAVGKGWTETPLYPALDRPRAAVSGDPMSLAVALDFAENPRRHATLQAPADSMDELREALQVLAAAYREARPRAAAGEREA